MQSRDTRKFWVMIVCAVMVVVAWTLACLGKSGKTQAARPDTPAVIVTSTDPFPIGVWFQPVSSFQKWRDRGINLLIGLELEGGNVTADIYIDKAHAMGFRIVANHPKADFLFNGPDEPDGQGNTTGKVWIASYKTMKNQYPGKLVFGNYDGEKTRWRPETDYTSPDNGYLAGCDIAGVDWYPLNKGLINEGGMDIYTSRIDTMVRFAAGKPVWVAIECSDQGMRVQDYLHTPENQPQGERWAKAMRCPTTAEQSAEVQIAIQHGAKGIFYFPDIIGKSWEGFDGTPEINAIQMRTDNLKLTSRPPYTPPQRGPLSGKTLTLDGWDYTLTGR